MDFEMIKKLVSITLLIAAMVGCKSENRSDETLIVGLQGGYPPFEFIDDNGKLVGYDLDLSQLIADRLGKKLMVQDMEFEGLILSLIQGKIDLIISGMNITPSRLQAIAMVPYYGDDATSFNLVFWNKIPEGVNTLEDIAKIKGASISVQVGTIPETYMGRYKDIPIKSFQGAHAPIMDVKYGKSIANLVEPDVAEYMKKEHPQIQILNVPLPEDEKIFGFGLGIKKENTEFTEKVSQIIQELKASGELKRLEDKWFKGIK